MSLTRTRHTWIILAVLVSVFAVVAPATLLLGAYLPVYHLPGWLTLVPWLLFTAAAYGAGKRYEHTWRTREGAIGADEHGISLDGRIVVRRRRLRHGHIVTEGERMFLRLHSRTPFVAPYDIEVADEAEARRLLAALRLDAQTSVAELELRWGTARAAMIRRRAKLGVGGLAFVLPILFLGRLGENIGLPLWLASCVLLAYFMSSSVVKVAVGADGLHVKRTFHRARFVPYADVRAVRLEGKDLHLELADGTAISLHRDEEGATLEQRIRDALSLHRARNANAAAVVNRGGRSTAEWLDATKERGATYRRAVVPDEELWAIVEDGAASPTERAGAALALRKELDNSGCERLRVAAGACAEKKLRVALESVASETDDEALAAVLEPLEDRRAGRRWAASR